jgi:hypothetical protein
MNPVCPSSRRAGLSAPASDSARWRDEGDADPQ